MPIRTPRGRAAAYRVLWQWPLRSPARLAVTAAAVVALGVGVTLGAAAAGGPAEGASPGGGAVGGGLARPSTGPSTTSGAPRTSGPATAGAGTLPPVPSAQTTTLPLSEAPSASLVVASRWARAWVRPSEGTTAQEWRDGLQATTTEEYLGVLGGVDPANIPSTRVTGEPRPVRVSARSVQVEVPTDTVTLLLLVVDTETGWRVAGYDRV